jgi:hypothetical protein
MATSLTLRTIAAQSMTLRSVDPVSLTLNAPVAGITPSIDGVPTISGLAKVNQTLTATAATSSGLPTPTDTFQWQRSDDGSTGWANISGAVNTTYTAVSADEGKYLRVVQTATNTVGSATANSASTAQVASAFEYLLDTYSGAAVAYSLRLLRSTYSGSAIRVRRTDDNEEQDIGFRNNELDTSTLETFCGSSDGFVTTWYDQSGNEYNITESTASKQQQIVSSGTTITDGDKPTITITQSTFNGFTISIPSSSRQDFFQVHKTNDDRFILLKDSASGTRYAYATIDGNTSTGLHGNYGTPSLYVNSSAEAPENRDELHTLLCTNNQILMSSIGADASAWTGNVIWGYYSSANVYDGNLQELIFYNSDQSSNRSGIETNINVFYSIYE